MFWDWDGLPQCPGVYKDTHKAFAAKCRKFVDDELLPNAAQWEEDGNFPKDLHQTAYKAGVFGALWPKEHGGTTPTLEEADMYHFWTLYDELGRACAGGLFASLFTKGFGLPAVLEQGSADQIAAVAKQVVTGQKKLCLAVTEPGGGSDVANVRTTAVKDPSGEFYIVNGAKTFISGGMDADWFTTGVRTGGDGLGGISLLLIPRHMEGVKVTRLKTQGWHMSTTCTIAFEDAKVPVSARLGPEGQGFKAIMRNFNNERLSIAIQSNRMARCCIEDALAYAKIRKTFGKPLVEHQVIRHKLMECSRAIMASHCMILPILANKPTVDEAAEFLAGPIALSKVQATKGFEFVARECSQIFGGKSYLRSGPGARVERCYREVRVMAIGGGSEEVMLDLASRQAKL